MLINVFERWINFQLYYIKDCERMTPNKTSSNHQRFFSNKKKRRKNYKKYIFFCTWLYVIFSSTKRMTSKYKIRIQKEKIDWKCWKGELKSACVVLYFSFFPCHLYWNLKIFYIRKSIFLFSISHVMKIKLK